MKLILMIIGFLSIMLFIYLLISGIKIVSTLAFYIIAVLAFVSAVGFIIYFIGVKRGNKQNN